MLTTVRTISSRVVNAVRQITFLRFGLNDVQETEVIQPYGTDANPIKGMVAIYAQTSVQGEPVIIGYINKNQLAEPGEHRTFSTDANGNVKTFIWLKNDGKIQLGGDADNAVRFSKLEDGFNALKADFNTFLTHVHGGSGSPPTPPQTPSTASISDAKINEILTS